MGDKVYDILSAVKKTAIQAGEAAGKAGKIVGEKAGDLFEKAKAQAKIVNLKIDINDAYKSIGKIVYAAHTGTDATDDNDQIADQLKLIDDKNAQIAELIAQTQADPAEDIKCGSCGGVIDPNDKYCKHCGDSTGGDNSEEK